MRRKRNNRPTPQRLDWFGTIAQNARGTSSIEVRMVRGVDGVCRLDIRRDVATAKYTGPTSKGISLKREEFERVVDCADAILKRFEELEQQHGARQAPGEGRGD